MPLMVAKAPTSVQIVKVPKYHKGHIYTFQTLLQTFLTEHTHIHKEEHNVLANKYRTQNHMRTLFA